jgi:SAM-dependent methyltransferase
LNGLLEVLELGCGNSPFCEEIYRDGITEITCNDLSAVAVEKMQKRSEAKGYKLEYVLKAKGLASQNRLLLNVVILNLGGNVVANASINRYLLLLRHGVLAILGPCLAYQLNHRFVDLKKKNLLHIIFCLNCFDILSLKINF